MGDGYHFSAGYKIDQTIVYRPDRCDWCKKPDKHTRQAQNPHGLRCYLCDKCLKIYYEKRRYYNYVCQSKLDACNYTSITAFNIHEDEPDHATVWVSKPSPKSNRHKIKYLEYERELKRLQEAT